MKLYVYRISDHEYGASTNYDFAGRRGNIVETWPLDTEEQANFLKLHGSSYIGVSELVSEIAEAVETLIRCDAGWGKPVQPSFDTPRPTLWQRLFA